jgi:uncharacterized membrane protein YvbJ
MPDMCPQCGANPPKNAQVCHICGKEFTPKAKNKSEETDERVRTSYQDVDIEEMDILEKIQAVDETLDDPEVKDMLFDKMEDDV